MILLVCPLSQVEAVRATHQPSHLLSLLSPDGEKPVWTDVPPDRTRLLQFHDIAEPRPDHTPPSTAMVRDLLAFGRSWDGAQPMLIHCWAGISRSTAAAYILACDRQPGEENALAQALRAASPTATPNPLMIKLADGLLGRDGRMVQAVAAIGRGAEAYAGEPFELPIPI
jgi:predicted protein tyrosine phosphatase